jgi:hypothetical protein
MTIGRRALVRFLAIAVVGAIALGHHSAPAQNRPAGAVGGIRRGMSVNEVTKLLGPPKRVTRQILFRRHIEQWKFDDSSIRIDFNCVRGEEPYVLNILDENKNPKVRND